ncbi:MAG: hypothetical protein NWE98_00605 [Candidatus Bathyarchaeota archaeon]|nr:hypothetical protein [Candidatus Bathyarchaeota archaeon]
MVWRERPRHLTLPIPSTTNSLLIHCSKEGLGGSSHALMMVCVKAVGKRFTNISSQTRPTARAPSSYPHSNLTFTIK